MNLIPNVNSRVCGRRKASAFSLAEVVVAISITAVAFSGVIKCYTQCTRRAQWSGYSLAAQAIANKELEQARAAVWDGANTNNELLNLNLTGWNYDSATKVGTGRSVAMMDLPVNNGTNGAIWTTNFVTVRMLNVNGLAGVQVMMVQVDTVWPFKFGGTKWYTNSVANYYAPDNRDPDDI